MHGEKGSNLIIDLTFQFSIKVIDFTEGLVID